jgi:GNAT superfamily N-acetyltransferase
MTQIQLIVRQAIADDLSELAKLRAQWTAENGGDAGAEAFAERFTDWYTAESSSRVVWIGQLSGAVIGMLNLAIFRRMPQPGRSDTAWGYIANVYVQPSHRNAAIGTQLLDAAVSYSRELGFARLVLNPSPRSVPFYARAGFRPATELMMLDLSGGRRTSSSGRQQTE